MLAFNKTLQGCRVGEAKLAPGFNLVATCIIHTVGPVWQGGKQGEAELLNACYVNSFELAKHEGLKAIAFPAISTGVYGYPLESATIIALALMKNYENQFERIIACCFSADDKSIYERIFKF